MMICKVVYQFGMTLPCNDPPLVKVDNCCAAFLVRDDVENTFGTAKGQVLHKVMKKIFASRRHVRRITHKTPQKILPFLDQDVMCLIRFLPAKKNDLGVKGRFIHGHEFGTCIQMYHFQIRNGYRMRF